MIGLLNHDNYRIELFYNKKGFVNDYVNTCLESEGWGSGGDVQPFVNDDNNGL